MTDATMNITHKDKTSPSYTDNHTISTQHGITRFPDNYSGPICVLLSSTDEKNLEKLNPVKLGKVLTKSFKGIINIKFISTKRLKITLDIVHNANLFLNSSHHSENGLSASIPSTLLFSLGVIRLDINVTETDFWDSLECSTEILSFRRINTKRDNQLVPSPFVELNFLSTSLPKFLSIYKVLFDVSPSVRSPVQCAICLRFGHTQKFCRSKERYGHCGLAYHNASLCPEKYTFPPICILYNLNHLSTDRSCVEWTIQKDIKKIMAVNNISYSEAAAIKRSGVVNSAFSYAQVTNNYTLIRTIILIMLKISLMLIMLKILTMLIMYSQPVLIL
ncbi:uncharacterized protein LOC126905642 [Daktulosphaira vitifoliae]|uniref:uncharacterized protein LOC126905642 n=1 Tax=Daktulosphaira vitifoliae TaxID=58002 RepID=UPI0021AAEEB3|nr:uncharacterized protein LOC126905642 [Daktulosphaira vitifoliae]